MKNFFFFLVVLRVYFNLKKYIYKNKRYSIYNFLFKLGNINCFIFLKNKIIKILNINSFKNSEYILNLF